ncbi:EF-hand domain-containing protein 1 [Fundulus heteroclitus]|uniref:EF-hand domain-containing protein 1 n=1 Tax=Fundulus heteroclitus TaxID=8078 RepID=UPI00165B4111|nr:EF-hand domain-containing protein 1 [Fundulus heteroclitus]
MSSAWNNHGLPFLPGYTFRDVTKSAFHRPQTLSYNNGYILPQRPTVGIGKEPLLSEQLNQQDFNELSFETPDIAYATDDQPQYEEFVPAHVALHKKILRFDGYFLEEIAYSPEEEHRVRPVVIYYYLEDDSMCIMEPAVENSGILQGKRLKRQRFPKNERGEHYQWKDLNIGMDLEVYGFKYHITQCDPFTKDFMESEGIVLNEPEPIPEDPYSRRRKKPNLQLSHTTPSTFDKLHYFLNMDRKVLRFYALYVTSDDVYKDTWPVIIYYYLVDDTVKIREVHERNNGRDPFPLFMHRRRIPKKLKPEIFPSCVMEVSKEYVDEYYSPKDFELGQTVKLQNHQFLLLNCDGFTREYYKENYPDMVMEAVEIPKTEEVKKKEIPPYNGFGSLENSLQNCLYVTPRPPKVKFLKNLENDHKVLRYTAQLDSSSPSDEGRCFILSYYLSDDMISIYEKQTRNSGIIGGKFLEKTRVPKPGSSVDNPEFYSPADLAIGATIEIFSHRFVLTNADLYVLKYMESISNQIPSQTLESLRQKLGVEMATDKPVEQNGETGSAS